MHSELTHDSVQSPWMLESMKPRLKTRGGATHKRCRGDALLATSQAPSATAATYTNHLTEIKLSQQPYPERKESSVSGQHNVPKTLNHAYIL